ncbi:MAG: Geranylfarnesyl diphosphate synthase [Methanosaeta sp. PtaU1.Bin060]|nr:MAG: Geranylfarnesyl diphosphate synthase [Methanosaeta sp. PtaU1.Bin060]
MFSGLEEYDLINHELAKLVKGLPESDLGEVISYVLSSPGKRVRPIILILSARAFGAPSSQALNAALAIELVHAASLVHDDILDCGVERRGSPSAIERFGTEAALLAGDYLISKSIELISVYSRSVIGNFSRACMSMSEGEMLDLSRGCTFNDYYRCISQKTASLFAASASIGCLIARAPQEDVTRLEQYGLNLGLAYQILDDLEEFLGIDQGKVSRKTSVILQRFSENMCAKDNLQADEKHAAQAALQMCVKAIEDHCLMAKSALSESSGETVMKSRLEGIVDEMTHRGLERCRSQKSLC